MHAILASRSHATRPCHSGWLVLPEEVECWPVAAYVIFHATSNKRIRPRHGVSSPPGHAVPTASIDCSAPLFVFRSWTLRTVWTCSPGSKTCCHAHSRDPGFNKRRENCSSTPPTAIAFARRVFTRF